MGKKFLVASDFDHTLSKNETGAILSNSIGITKYPFKEKLAELRKMNLVQLGGELTYLIANDKDFKGKITRQIMTEACSEVELKDDVKEFIEILNNGIDDNKFLFRVISAGPEMMVTKALEGILPPEHIYASRYNFDDSGTVTGIERGGGGQAKVDIMEEIIEKENIPRDNVIYIGDGSSDYNVMLHIAAYGGYPIAVRFKTYIGHISKITVVSHSALANLIPILQNKLNYNEDQIHDFFHDLKRPLQKRDLVNVEFVTVGK
jgi:HAD superfamily phosphoserine phosphatase-like hydrolase